MQLLHKRPVMPRSILDETHIHPAIRERVATHQQAIVREVQSAVERHAVVVVGMGLNPFPKKARKLLGRGRRCPPLPGIRQLPQ
jgi:hypothetical protein